MAIKDDMNKVRQKAIMAKEKKSAATKSRSARQMEFGPMITLLIFSTAMLVLPLGTYFYIRRYLVDSTTYGAMGAIVMVQVIVAAYIYKAWSDENKEHQEQLKSQKKHK